MKYLLPLVCVFVVFSNAFSQTPQYVPYQAVARDASGNLLVNQAVSLRFTIHDVSGSGTVLYQEKQSATTNNLGLFSVNIGNGTVVTGTFSSIPWGNGNAKYTQVEIDPTGGTSYTSMGASQMMSVPYALYAGNASSVTSSNLSESTSDVLTITGGSNSVVSASGTTIQVKKATSTQDGYLSSGDWGTFNAKQAAITLTTNNASGAATFSSNTLNIPNYTLAGLGGIGLSALSASSPLSYSSGAFSISQAGTSGNGYLSSTDWNTFNNKQAALTFTQPLSNTANTVAIGYDNNTIKMNGSNQLYAVNTGTITGSGAANQMTYFSSASNITSSSTAAFIPNNSGAGSLAVTSSATTANSEAISGSASGNGVVYGVFGTSSSTTSGAGGVYGSETGTSGVVYGAGGVISSTTAGAAGVLGDALGTTGATYGVYGLNASATAGSAGVFGSSTGGNGYGVYGSSTGSGANIGGYFSATGGTSNYGLIVPSGGGNVGIGNSAPNAKLTIGAAMSGTTLSSTFVSNAGALGTSSGNSLILGNFGFTSGNVSSLGIHALRTSAGSDWTTTALGLLYDVDNTSPVNNAQIWMNSSGNVGIGTSSPSYNLDVNGSFRVLTNSTALSISGGNATTNGAYTVVAFTSSGTFTPTGPMTVDVLVVGGGGGGGGNGGGGGGAGGVVENSSYVVTGPVTVTIGTGGAGSANTSTDGSNGNPSSFGEITAFGGGGGASRASGQAALGLTAGSAGNTSSTGSGGGGGGCSGSSACTGGYGTSGQGNNGGTGYSNSSCTSSGAGGGGAGGVGGNAGVSTGGAGGAGIQLANFSTGGGSPAGWFGGGGGGAAVCYNPSSGGAASNGGGGAGSNGQATAGSAGIANTGGGGGGGGTGNNGSAGGSGIVIIRYQTSTAVSDPTVIATSGSNVGIGTSSPTSTLQVSGSFQTTTMHLVTYSNSLTSSGHFQVTASCANGGTMISGGCYDNDDDLTGNTGNTALEMSYPLNSTTWRCGSRDISTLTTRTLTAYAICTQ